MEIHRVKTEEAPPESGAKGLTEQRVEDCGDCNQTHHDNEYLLM